MCKIKHKLNVAWIAVEYGKEIDYMVDPKYPQYSANLYDYEAYGSSLKGEVK